MIGIHSRACAQALVTLENMTIYQKLKKLLFDAGLSEAEVALYSELLKKPAESIWDLVQRTGFRKSTVYDAFARLKALHAVEKTAEGIHALSLKALVAELHRTRRKVDKTAYQIQQIAPFLHTPPDSVEEFETFYTSEQIADTYLSMAKLPYDINFDFGDFENFITAIGTNELALKFRELRAKHASNHAICTTMGPNLAVFLKKEEVQKYKNKFELPTHIDFKNRWIIFSDKSHYVMYNDVSDREYPIGVLIKSKAMADMERSRFRIFSDALRNG